MIWRAAVATKRRLYLIRTQILPPADFYFLGKERERQRMDALLLFSLKVHGALLLEKAHYARIDASERPVLNASLGTAYTKSGLKRFHEREIYIKIAKLWDDLDQRLEEENLKGNNVIH